MRDVSGEREKGGGKRERRKGTNLLTPLLVGRRRKRENEGRWGEGAGRAEV